MIVPEPKYSETKPPQRGPVSPISGDIGFDLCHPEPPTNLQGATYDEHVSPVPERAVDEDRYSCSNKENVWMARKRGMKAIPQPKRMESTSEGKLRLGVLPLYSRHVEGNDPRISPHKCLSKLLASASASLGGTALPICLATSFWFPAKW